ELADLVVFLASERAGYITGQSIAADGGWIRGSSRVVERSIIGVMRGGLPILLASCALLPLFLQAQTATPPKKKLLFLTHAALYKHASLGPAERAVTDLGKLGGFDVTTVEGYKQDADKIDLASLTADYLAQFDGLMMMTNGNLPLSDAQKRALLDFVRSGK